MSLTLKIAVLIILILINAFFAMSEMAVVSLNDTKIKKMASNGHKKAKKIVKLTSDSAGFLSTGVFDIGISITKLCKKTVQSFSRAVFSINEYGRIRNLCSISRDYHAHHFVLLAGVRRACP